MVNNLRASGNHIMGFRHKEAGGRLAFRQDVQQSLIQGSFGFSNLVSLISFGKGFHHTFAQ